MKKYGSVIVYAIIIAALVLLILGGQSARRTKPQEYTFGELSEVIREGMETGEGEEYEQNSRIAGVRISGTELYGLYTPAYYKEVNGKELTEKEAASRLDSFNKGRLYDFHSTVMSAENFRNEMSGLVCKVTGTDKDSVTVSDYGFSYDNDVEQTSWFWMLFPYLIMGAILIGSMLIIVRASGRL